MLNKLFRKLASLKQKIQHGSKYDELNLTDEVRERSPLVKSVVDRTARIMFQQAIGTEIAIQPEDYDIDQKASLAIQEFVITSVSANPTANLITIEIVAGAAEEVEVIDNHIKITTEDAVSDHDSILALIEASSQASALIMAEINSGEGATLVDAQATQALSGAIG